MTVIEEIEQHDVISVEPKAESRACMDVYVEPGEYWSTVSVVDLQQVDRGRTEIVLRSNGQAWAA